MALRWWERAGALAPLFAVLQVNGLKVEVGGVVLSENVSFTVRAGEKVGLVGRNGAGKTSMLKVIGGAADAAAGSVRFDGGLGYLPQDPRLDLVPEDVTALRHVLSGRGFDDALERIAKLQAAMEADPTERNIDRYTRALDRFGMEGGYSAESEVRRLAAGIGLADEKLDLPLGALSGGQRRRVEVVRILFAGSDVLLLDEPTNHLDADAKSWMLSFLRDYRGALIVISH
ncbi:MAG: ABC-F family ATP-binding cassette domain-containing protein, partial [Acidimicrobiales bacterium]|nr:ABC-F family ATP-binding cassette domain-containing protein [Acidimicrobiales bacterium]